MFERIYLDYNATAPLLQPVREAIDAAAYMFGNPSSIHEEGRKARAEMEKAREQIARILGAQSHLITFTSGGSEANALACANQPAAKGTEILFVGSTEHASVREAYRNSPPEWIPVSSKGLINLSWLDKHLSETRQTHPEAHLRVTIQFANSETGVIQPIAHIADCVHKYGGWLHCDAVQGLGKIPCKLSDLGADSYAFSAHKIGGPKGIGALVFSSETAQRHCHPFMRAGGQEKGYRGGTENVAGIVGFSVALALWEKTATEVRERMQALRDSFESFLQTHMKAVTIIGKGVARLPNTSLFLITGFTADRMLMALDLQGFALSSGSACSSGTVKDSPVLTAMGYSLDMRKSALRLSLGPQTTEHELALFQKALLGCTTPLRV